MQDKIEELQSIGTRGMVACGLGQENEWLIYILKAITTNICGHTFSCLHLLVGDMRFLFLVATYDTHCTVI